MSSLRQSSGQSAGRSSGRSSRQALVMQLLIWGGVIALVIWIARNTYWDEITLPADLRGEAATNEWYVLEHFAQALQIKVTRIDSAEALPDTNAVVFVHNWNWGVLPERQARIRRWAEQGGRLVLDSAAYNGDQEINDWLQVDLQYVDTDDEEDEAEDNPETTTEESADDTTDNTESAASANTKPAAALLGLPDCQPLDSEGSNPLLDTQTRYSFCNLSDYHVLTSKQTPQWLLRNPHGMYVLRLAAGAGTVTLLNSAPFNNRSLLQGDNALLLAAVLQLHQDDHLYLLNEPEYASLLALIWRHGAPVVLAALLLIALWLWRHGSRFGPPLANGNLARRSLAEQIRGTSQFLLRLNSRLRHTDHAQVLYQSCLDALHQAAQRHLAHYAQLDTSQRVQHLAKLAGVDAEALRLAMNHTGARPRHDWQQAITLLETVRRKLLATSSSSHSPTATS